jgi:hypothetical protein
MQRRNLLIGMGSLAAGGAATIGTGAFSTVTANRTVNVSVADDNDALLAFDASGNDNSAYATKSGAQISIDLDSSNSTTEGGEGINQDATTEIFDIFDVENQGTQNAIVYVPPTSVDNQGGFDRDDDGLYFDPQVSNMPNGNNSPDASFGTRPDGTRFTSLTNIGGTILNKGSTFAEATLDTDGSTAGIGDSVGPNPPEIYLLRPGESFEFGVYLDATDAASTSQDFQYDIEIKADAELAKEAGLGSV